MTNRGNPFSWAKCGHPTLPERQEDCYACAQKALEYCREALRKISAMTIRGDVDAADRADPRGRIIWKMAELATDALEKAKGCPAPKIVEVKLTNESIEGVR